MCMLSTLCVNIDKYNPIDIYIYTYMYLDNTTWNLLYHKYIYIQDEAWVDFPEHSQCDMKVVYNISNLWHQKSTLQRVYKLIIQILYKYMKLLYKIQWPNQAIILHMSWQLSCCDMCKIDIQLVQKNSN